MKGDGVKGWAEIPVPLGGARRRLDAQNAGVVFEWFGEMAAPHMAKGPVVFVPIPGSKAISPEEVRAGTAYRLARALAARTDAVVEVLLWWKHPMQSSRSGGPRDPAILFANLEVNGAPSGDVVLIDDVCTSGGHLQAAAAAIEQQGADVLFAICAAQSEQFETEEPFAVSERELSD